MPVKPVNQSKDAAGFEVVEHTADWAIRVWGGDLEELFVSAAEGMGSLMVADLAEVPMDVERVTRQRAHDEETLLVDWLGELAFWAEDEQLVFRKFDLQITPGYRLTAVARGGRADELVKHIKAVTFHDLAIVQTSMGLEVTVVFDV
jgi:SHS2 domain-containing protein